MCIVNDRVHWRVLDNVQVPRKVFLALISCKHMVLRQKERYRTDFIDSHEFFGSVRLRLVQWDELDVLWCASFVSKRALDCIEVMRPNRNKLPAPAQVLM